MRFRNSRVEQLEIRQLLAADSFRITEFMAVNDTVLVDSFGETPDWIEIHNSSEEALDLVGWSVTDDPSVPSKWTFPSSLVVPGDGYLVVFASDRDGIQASEPHVHFKLKSNGEYLALFDSTGSIANEFGGANTDYPNQRNDVSYGIDATGRERFYLNPTPGAPNDDSSGGLVSDTKFSADRGFYEDAFTVNVKSETPFATLVYTLDGTEPTSQNGTRVVGGSDGPSVDIDIDSTSTLRAMAFRDDWTSTNVDTQTYLFLDQVIRQTGDGLPNTWGHAGADYEMDPEIVDAVAYRDVIVDSLKSLPTVSLVTDIDNWFGTGGTGIYPQGQSSPRGVSVEMLFPESGDDVQADGSVEIQGGSSTNRWKSDKLSMQLKFKRQYGDSKLEYPIYGPDATNEFDTLILDARLNQAWHYGGGVSPTSQRARAQYTRDQFVANLQRELGGEAPHGRWVHLYLNGIYWGIHNLHERPDEHFAAAYVGGEAEDYDIIKHNDDVVNGSLTAYRSFLSLVEGDVSEAETYRQVEEQLDVQPFINYMLTNYFVGNTDWAHHNWYVSRNAKSGDGKWRYHSWDAEHSLKELNDDATGRNDELGPTAVHRRLMLNDEYRLQFMDSVQAYFFNGGKLTPENTTAMYQERAEEVYDAVVAESARWGDNQRSRPFTRDREWVRERDRLLEDYFPARSDVVLNQLRNRRFFHRYAAPSFSQHGGKADAGFEVDIDSGGTVFYTLDGSDPRTSNTAREYLAKIQIDETVVLKARALRSGDEWSAITVAEFDVGLLGDFSNDGLLNSLDIDLLRAGIAQDGFDSKFDLDENGELNEKDVDYWLTQLAGTRRGDTDLNGTVNFRDFLQFALSFGKSNATWADGDYDGDSKVTFLDFLVLATQFGQSGPDN